MGTKGALGSGPTPLSSDYRGLCPRFDLGVVTRYAHDSHIPEMLQAIFYAVLVDDVAELGLSRRLIMDCMMWAMQKLDWGPILSWLIDIDRRLRRAQTSQCANPPVRDRAYGKKGVLLFHLLRHHTRGGIRQK